VLEQQINGFMEYLEVERRLSPRTLRTYGADLRALADFVAERGLPEDATRLDLHALRAFLASLAGHAGSGTTARRISALRTFYRHLQRRHGCARNPAAELSRPKVRSPLPRCLSVTEADQVLEASANPTAAVEPIRDRALVELFYGAGLRVSELAALDVCSLQLDDRSLLRVMGKGGKERIVPLGAPAIEALRAYLGLRPQLRGPRDGGQDPVALFLGVRGGRLGVRQIQKLVKRFGQLGTGRGDLHPHALRHSCATHLLDAGADLRSIQELLGHASLSTTQRYTHLSTDRLQEVYANAHPLGRDRGIKRRSLSSVGQPPEASSHGPEGSEGS